MSSTIEGSDDGDREDQLDLGQDDEELPLQPNGHTDHDRPGEDVNDALSHNGEPLSVTQNEAQKSPYVDSAPDGASDGVLSSQQGYTARAPGSVDGTASTPDDTPSLHGSLRSSPSGSPLPLRGHSRLSPSPSHRPFDLRFQSRLSSPSLSSRRPSSPFYFQRHSRQSSLASQLSPSRTESESESPQTPWDVVRWTKLRKIAGQAFSEVGKRNFGRPTCLTVSTTIVIGTSKAVESGAVTSLALSADHSTVAGGHASGDIYTWEISRSARPFLHIPPISGGQLETQQHPDGHIAGVSVLHVGFLATRRTALVSADDRGMAFSHLATRGMGAVGRTVKTTRILGRYPEKPLPGSRPRKPSSVLAFSPLPLGNVEQATDSLGLVAMLTPYLLVVVSTTPVAQTQHKAPRPREVASHGAMTAALAWFPAIKLKGKDSQTSNTKLVYCWSNVLTVLEVSEVEPEDPGDKDRPPVLEFKPRSRWRADEAIVAVQWLSRSVLAVLTITQQLLILEDTTLRVTDSFDLLQKHIYHADLFSAQLHSLVEQYNEEDPSMHGVVADAFYMSFRAYKGRLFLLGFNEVSVGSLSNWADRLLALMEAGDFIGAIRLATAYYRGDTEKLTVGLPEEDELRHAVVRERLMEMISASLKYAFGRNREANTERLEKPQLEDLAEASLAACVCIEDEDFLWEEVYNWYEENDSTGIFLDVLESYTVDGDIRSLPPTAVKALINHYATNHTSTRLEEIICLLDTTTMDIDQVTSLCKQYNLYDAFIYVWNRTLGDYIGPLEELIGFIRRLQQPLINGSAGNEENYYNNAAKVFPYLSFVLTGRIYPTGEEMDEPESTKAKTALYGFLFSGHRSIPVSQAHDGFANLRAILGFDTPSFMSMLNEAFEDSFLNEAADHSSPSEEPETNPFLGVSVNRQYIISILLEVMSPSEFSTTDTIYLDMFIARNLPKYPQYILLSGTTLHQVLVRLCQFPSEEMAEDCELSVEYLLSMYHPPDIQSLIPLFKEARFYRILKSTYRSEKQFPEWILTYLEDESEQESVFACIQDCLRPGSGLGKKQRRDVLEVIKNHAGQLADINVTKAAQTIQDYASHLHENFLQALDEDTYRQFIYLSSLLEPKKKATPDSASSKDLENWMIERYVQLMCKYNPSHVADFVDSLRTGELRLEEVLPFMEDSGVVDAAVMLLARQGQVRVAMDRLIAHLRTLESALVSLLQNAGESPDMDSTTEAINGLLESFEKYTQVGTWLCQNQTRTAKKTRALGKNGKRGVDILQQPLSFEENLWLDLIETVVRIARNVSSLLNASDTDADTTKSVWSSPSGADGEESGQLTTSFRKLVQQVFTALLTSTARTGGASSTDRTDMSFLRILRSFLTRAASWSPSLTELRSVLASIFAAYAYEEALLSLANGMLDKDLFVHVDEVTKLRQRGWRPRGQVCEICRRRIWGPGAGSHVWRAWEKKQEEQRQRRELKRVESSIDHATSRGKGKAAAEPSGTFDLERHEDGGIDETSGSSGGQGVSLPGPVVVFACRHLYHRQCLLDAPQLQHPGRASHASREHSHVVHEGSNLEFSCPTCT
ncbi:Vacuolar protein sorting-associated protein 8 [Paecilomyces lecythidis]